jgi:hypothetical protein
MIGKMWDTIYLLLWRMSQNETQDCFGVDMPRGEPHVQTCRKPCRWYHMVIRVPDVPAWAAYKLIIQSGTLPEHSVPLPIPSLRVHGNEYKEHQMGTSPNYQYPMPINTRVLPKSLHKCIWDKPHHPKKQSIAVVPRLVRISNRVFWVCG